MPITKDQLTKGGGEAYPPGVYQLEIKEASMLGGTGKDGKPWEKVKLQTEIVEPSDLEGRKFTTSLWIDKKLGDVITIGLGKSLDEIFGKNDKIENDKLIPVLEGGFVRVRLGVKNGFNEITEVIASEEEGV